MNISNLLAEELAPDLIIHNPTKRYPLVIDYFNEGVRHLKFKIDPLVGHRKLLRKSAKRLGYMPDLAAPRTYNEKIIWRKAFDRNPIFPIISDKVAVRDFVRQKLGQEACTDLFADLYAVTDRVDDFDMLDLPERYVVKANHASGWNIFVSPDTPVDMPALKDEARRWLRRSYGKNKHEWAYQPIQRKVLFEEMLLDAQGQVARDIKFAVFNGECRFIVLIEGRFGNHCWYHMTPDWQRMISTPRSAETNPDPVKPNWFDEMKALAEKIARVRTH